MIFISFPVEEIIIPCSYRAPFVPSDLLHPPTTSNLYLPNSLAAALKDPAL
jgi:hypothetical protein